MKQLEQNVRTCTKCPLHKTRTNAVPGEGDYDADIMFIGEAPGYNEDQQGIPFCGRAGTILDELLDSVGIKRKNIYITNILKCRPPDNRNPKTKEIETCTPYLEKQISVIKPKKIVCLGNFATRFVMKKYNLDDKIEGITRLHGKVFKVGTLFGTLRIIPMYHPAASIYDPKKLPVLKEDFKLLK